MGNIESYREVIIEAAEETAVGDDLPLQLVVVDEKVSVVLSNIASNSPNPFDKLTIRKYDDNRLDISWMFFGWQKASGDYVGAESGAECCSWAWDFAREETAKVIEEWRSREISEDREKQLPRWVFECVTKLLEYLHDKSSIPVTVCIAHHFICCKGDFVVENDVPLPLHAVGQFERLGLEIIRTLRQFMLWLGGKVEPPRFDGRLLMENVRRTGKTQRIISIAKPNG